MKKLTIPLSICFLYCTLSGAQTIKFTYDACGNRIKREVVLSQKAMPQTISNPHEEILSARKVKIYPNPTKGALKIEVSGLGTTESYIVTVYSLEGRPVLNESVFDPTYDCDISSQPNGMYIMRLTFGDREESVWKIIKE